MRSIKAKIGGKEREFSLGTRAIGNVLKYFDNDMEQYVILLQTNGFLSAAPTLFFMHEHSVKREQGTIDFTLEDFEDWIDDLEGKFHNEEVQKVLVEFIGTLKDYLPKTNEQKAKKK